MKYTITKLAKQFGLSKSTLLYYDDIGLLKPSYRTFKNYRIYGEKEYRRLKKISLLHQTGLSLNEIKKILDSEKSKSTEILEKRLEQIFVITLILILNRCLKC